MASIVIVIEEDELQKALDFIGTVQVRGGTARAELIRHANYWATFNGVSVTEQKSRVVPMTFGPVQTTTMAENVLRTVVAGG